MPVSSKKFEEITNCKNSSLYFNKFAFSKISNSDNNNEITSKILSKLSNSGVKVQEANLRKDVLINSLKKNRSLKVIDLVLRTKHRFLIGAGSPSAYEVGFHFDRNNGYPVIPGSSLKGAFFHFLEDEALATRNTRFGADSGKIRKWQGFSDETGEGGESGKGEISFLDAIPCGNLRLERDIINNHFTKYYDEKSILPPNDWYEPIPVTFIAVAKNTKMRFSLVLRKEDYSNQDFEEIQRLFKEMLSDWGVGAKTAYGYGRFTE